MFEFCLLALTWSADPVIFESANRLYPVSTATCVRPAVLVIQPNSGCALANATRPDTSAAGMWLRRWQKGTQTMPEWSRSQREDLRRRMHEEFNEHTAAAVEQLIGRVKEDVLTERHDWRIIAQSNDRVCLEAIPRDETERLFYAALRVWLDIDSEAPQELIVVHRNHDLRTAWQAERASVDQKILLVNFENGVPPAPNAPVRTANSQIDSHRR